MSEIDNSLITSALLQNIVVIEQSYRAFTGI